MAAEAAEAAAVGSLAVSEVRPTLRPGVEGAVAAAAVDSASLDEGALDEEDDDDGKEE